mgnify:CR=1 FL=1|tara:strand:+ start:718 stop:1149 length:432 start_codon:yes stop_codon:yes gene_type:complete
MTIHLLKPALKVQDLFEFSQRQKTRWMEHEGELVYPVWTSRKPAREEALLDGGSLFWIIKKQIRVRQNVLAVVPYESGADEKPSYLILCSPELIRVEPVRKKPFQGWRYLEAENAPPDIGRIMAMDEPPPPEMEKDLREAGLL